MPELSPLQIMLLPIVGVVVAVFSVASKLIGTPDQIRKNYQRKSTEGVSFLFFLFSFVSYMLWALYGALREDWVVFIAHGVLGVIVTGIVLLQFFVYRKTEEDNQDKS